MRDFFTCDGHGCIIELAGALGCAMLATDLIKPIEAEIERHIAEGDGRQIMIDHFWLELWS